jgi:hypothetical protein
MSVPPSTFSTDAADGPQNTHAITVPSNDEICDRTGFKVPRGTLRPEWNGAMVRRQSWEPRHPQDFVKGRAECPKGSPRPEQPDIFIADDDPIEARDL